MYTIITYPGAEAHEQDLAAIGAYLNGATNIETHDTPSGARILFALSLDGHYLTLFYGHGYYRLSVTEAKTEALWILDLLKEHHGVSGGAIG